MVLAGLGAVGQAGGVAEVDVVGAGDEREQSAEDGEAAEAGVEDADGKGFCVFGWRLGLKFCAFGHLAFDCWLFEYFDYECFACGLLSFCWGLGMGGGVGGGVGAEEVGVAGEGVVGLAVDEEANG